MALWCRFRSTAIDRGAADRSVVLMVGAGLRARGALGHSAAAWRQRIPPGLAIRSARRPGLFFFFLLAAAERSELSV